MALFMLAPDPNGRAALGFSFSALCAWGAEFGDFTVAVERLAPHAIRTGFRDLGQGM